MPVYARASVWVGGTLLFVSIGLSAGSPAYSLQRLGRNTLGVFVLHKYVMLFFASLLPVWTIAVAGIGVRLDALLLFVLTSVASIACVAALKKTRIGVAL